MVKSISFNARRCKLIFLCKRSGLIKKVNMIIDSYFTAKFRYAMPWPGKNMMNTIVLLLFLTYDMQVNAKEKAILVTDPPEDLSIKKNKRGIKQVYVKSTASFKFKAGKKVSLKGDNAKKVKKNGVRKLELEDVYTYNGRMYFGSEGGDYCVDLLGRSE